jgi:hypothetical protein
MSKTRAVQNENILDTSEKKIQKFLRGFAKSFRDCDGSQILVRYLFGSVGRPEDNHKKQAAMSALYRRASFRLDDTCGRNARI